MNLELWMPGTNGSLRVVVDLPSNLPLKPGAEFTGRVLRIIREVVEE